MKISYICAFLCASVAVPMSARMIDRSEAESIAARVAGAPVRAAAADDAPRGRSVSAEPYYIFNSEAAGSFVVVAGDDRLPQVLAYGDGTVDVTEMPVQMQDMLASYARVVAEAGRDAVGKAPASTPVLLHTALWNQRAPYNQYCPTQLTGCAATAMAILMKYHEYPARGMGSNTYTSYGETQSMDFDFEIDWDNMLDSYDGEYTPEQGDAVAKLMRACGVAINMQYGLYESSANTTSIPYLAKYFRYSNSTEAVYSGDFTPEQWYDMLDNELDCGRPVVYRGADANDSNGHIFIIDGRDGEGLYHINWGWGGNCNGYFALAVMNPQPYYDYSYYHWMVVNAVPEYDGPFRTMTLKSYNGSNGLNFNSERLKAGEPVYFNLARLENRDNTDAEGIVAVCRTDADDNIKEILVRGAYHLPSYYGYNAYGFGNVVPKTDAEPGDKVGVFYMPAGTSEWIPVEKRVYTQSEASAYDNVPVGAPIHWEVDSRLMVKNDSQLLSYALCWADYAFKVETAPGAQVDAVEVTVGGAILLPDDSGKYVLYPRTEDAYDIAVKAYPAQSGVEDAAPEMTGPVSVYNLQGVRVMQVASETEWQAARAGLAPGVYLVRRGEATEKYVSR